MYKIQNDFCIEKYKLEKLIFSPGKKSKMKKSPTFSYNLPYENHEKSPVMKLKLLLPNGITLCTVETMQINATKWALTRLQGTYEFAKHNVVATVLL